MKTYIYFPFSLWFDHETVCFYLKCKTNKNEITSYKKDTVDDVETLVCVPSEDNDVPSVIVVGVEYVVTKVAVVTFVAICLDSHVVNSEKIELIIWKKKKKKFVYWASYVVNENWYLT